MNSSKADALPFLLVVCLFLLFTPLPISLAGEGMPGRAGDRVEMGVIGTDDELASLVRYKLEAYPQVIVKTKGGIVTLSGAVFNELKRQEVLEIVRSTGGVEGVDDFMRVRY